MRRANERGSALLVALGVLVLLSMMGVTFAILTRMEMQAATNFDTILRARELAESGLQRALTELQTLYVGPLFRPRYDDEPPSGGLSFEVAKPYRSTVAAAQCQTWGGGRGIELSGAVDIYTLLEDVVLPDPVSDDSAPYLWGEPSLWSGPGRGRLDEGYFDGRFGMEPTSVNTATAPPETFRVVRGVVDLSGLVNVNRANVSLLEGLLTYFNIATPDVVAGNIVTSRTDDGPFRYTHELVDRGLLTMSQLYGEDANANGLLDSGEDSNGNGVLDGALKDFITVFPILGAINALSSRININTAPEPVLFAVFYGVGVPGLDATDALNLARAVILYRSGGPAGDGIEGVASEEDPDGDGNTIDASDLNADGDTDDLFSDDNPFDGVVSFLVMVPVNWLPEFADDGLDNDGDTVPQELMAGGADAFDRHLFPNGPGGFSEFEFFMDTVNGDVGLGIPDRVPGVDYTDTEIAEVKANASTRADIDFDGDGDAGTDGNPPEDWERSYWTAPFRYDSDRWLIISRGIVERGGEVQAQATLSAVLSYRQ